VPQENAVVTTGGDAQIAYPSPSGWALGGATDTSGVAALLNATSEVFPGKSIDIYVESAGVSKTFSAAVENDAVSVLPVTVGF